MDYINSTPAADGFRMPAEFERHQGCIMIWPERPGSWAYGAKAAKKAFAQIASVISESEHVYMIVSEGRKEEAAKMLPETVRLVVMDTDDAWARDTGPTFVVSGNVDTPYEARDLRGINWEFNAWGGTYDGLYADWDNDNLVAGQFMSYLGCQGYNAAPFVLEGGSIHTDGEGTMLVTESCLLSRGRNPQLSRKQIEDKLKQYCNVSKIIWLPCGIYNDETNEHVDNVCAFTAPGEVVLAWTDDENDPQYEMSKACLSVLENVTDAKGRGMIFTGDGMDFSALPYTPHEIENAMHPYELPQVHYTVVRVSKKQMGIAGDDSWGAKTHPEFLLDTSSKMKFTFTFKGI